ncbi:serine protease [Candidatus Phytoplasma luffae]|uniref:Serine protease n=1 Tax=Loofah witches'-broom phytoplasma TaxID=35773 RepID=A0A975ILR5_LOWBP|nr:serine protease [Candidatus Phytoplasma luffae]QTX02588.1 serine protease [Candidatus Phytoplasma luffae]
MKIKNINFLFKNKITNLILFYIFLFFLLFYYICLFQINKKQILKNDFPKNKNTIEKNAIIKDKAKIIEKIQKEIKQIFNNEKKEKPCFDINPYYFEKGETVYAFNLDVPTDTQSFQEGIISESYNIDNINKLPISIKGENNKIFFNQKGKFIGISLPEKNTNEDINYIITSNSLFYFVKCKNHKIDNSVSNEEPYYFWIRTEDSPEQKNKILLNEKGLFTGFNQKNIQQNQIQNVIYNQIKEIIEYHLCLDYKRQLQQKIKQKIPKTNHRNNDQIEKIKDIDKITFAIKIENNKDDSIILGSGFIFEQNPININNNEYKYYFVTNRHVIDNKKNNYDDKNTYITIYNKFLEKINNVKIIGTLDNDDIYDDIAILTFTKKFENNNKPTEITEILKKAFPEKQIDIHQGEVIYSMGSQRTKTSEKFPETTSERVYNKFNLLKKGNIISYHDKEINFDITIDSGNSGGPVFNEEGEIIGINKSTIKSENSFYDKISQCINIKHIKKTLNKIFEILNNNNNNKINPFLTELNKYDPFLEQELNSFPPFSTNSPSNNEYINDINISISKFINYLNWQPNQKIKSKIIKSNIPEIIFNMDLIIFFQEKDITFSIDPTEEQIEIHLNNKKKEIIFTKYSQNNQKGEIIKKYNIKDINDFDFFSLKIIENPNKNNIITDKKTNLYKLNKIKNSLIVWETNHKKNSKNGNGIIFHKQKISEKKYLYFVISTFNIDKNNLEHLTEPIKNIFENKIKINTYFNEYHKKEKGEIKSFLFDKNDLVLITFESEHNYDVIKHRPIEDLNLGEEIFFLINDDNDDYIPQMFKSAIGNKQENHILCDSVFNLKNKNKKINKYKFIFFYFDSEGNLIGMNNNSESSNNIPEYFNKVFSLEKSTIEKLILNSQIKKFLNIGFSIFFINSIFFIFITSKNYKKNYKLFRKNYHILN